MTPMELFLILLLWFAQVAATTFTDESVCGKDSSYNTMSFGYWRFRPLALNHVGYETMSRGQLFGLYHDDNVRAQQETSSLVRTRPENTQIRTCQWNINYFRHAQRTLQKNAAWAAKDIANELLQTDADIYILNEFGIVGGAEPAAQELMRLLKDNGYQTFLVAQCDCPTAIVTKLSVKESQYIYLDGRRAAVGLEVKLRDGSWAWVYGTHLEDHDGNQGRQRLLEMQALLEQVKKQSGETQLILGDLNQQRQQDYTPEEWKAICASKAHRQSPQDDGVARALHQAGFSSIWDAKDAVGNWPTGSKPPSTHWTGTIVDYAYAKGATPLQILVGSSNLSDHRPIVVDWTI